MNNNTFKYGKVINRMSKNKRFMTRYDLVKFALIKGNKEAAREHKTSANVVRKWVSRYKTDSLKGLYDKSRRPHFSPNKCPLEFEKEVIKIRKQTKHKFGAVRLIERFNLEHGKSCVQRIINQHHLKRKKKTKKMKRNELWSVKKLMNVFQKIQIDVKELTDIPLYVSAYRKHKLPKYEFTARCVKTGAAFVCYARRNTAMNAATFASYLLDHLKDEGFDLSKIEIQTDNGSEFNAGGRKKEGHMPFEFIIREIFHTKLGYIPPASPTFNSDVETFHRLVEDEFYAIEPISSLDELRHKCYTYLIEFNYLRKNSYKDNKTPLDLALEELPNFNKQLFNLAPIILDDHKDLYLQYCDNNTSELKKISGKPDPFLNKDMQHWLPHGFKALGGNDVPSLHILTEIFLTHFVFSFR